MTSVDFALKPIYRGDSRLNRNTIREMITQIDSSLGVGYDVFHRADDLTTGLSGSITVRGRGGRIEKK